MLRDLIRGGQLLACRVSVIMRGGACRVALYPHPSPLAWQAGAGMQMPCHYQDLTQICPVAAHLSCLCCNLYALPLHVVHTCCCPLIDAPRTIRALHAPPPQCRRAAADLADSAVGPQLPAAVDVAHDYSTAIDPMEAARGRLRRWAVEAMGWLGAGPGEERVVAAVEEVHRVLGELQVRRHAGGRRAGAGPA